MAEGRDGFPYRVLVVDDEPDFRLLLHLQLDGEQGFQVVGHAGDGTEALQQCRALDPDLIVMDLLMPGVSGFEAIPLVQAEFPHIGIVAYSAVAGDFARAETQRLGVELVLKSGDVQSLASALRRAAPPLL
jgi:two-component system, NarL family, nitrate/nitrite response regulator NarL